MKPLNKYFDHTCLKANATSADIVKLCAEAKEYGFFAVCVNSAYVPLAKSELAGTDIRIASVIGFPLGAMSTESKTFEANDACANGADEIDMVINVGFLKDGKYEAVREDIECVVAAADEYDAAVKVILETCLLTDAEIETACELAVAAGAAFVKTSTGFSSGGAMPEHVALMRRAVGNLAEVKASGGIRDLKTCMAMIEAGADRIGASASVRIMNEFKNPAAK